MTTDLVAVDRLTRDMAKASVTLSPDEARYLVDAYYTVQGYRIAAENQIRALTASGEPHDVIAWLSGQMATLEHQVQRALDAWTMGRADGVWARSIVGIGPVIAAGLLAHIDILKAPTVGHIWRFAGLDPTVTWEKKEKRPWNADLKTLCWKTGESFVKVSGNDADVYGHVYAERKAEEIERNERGEFAAQAAAKLERFKIGKGTEAFKAYSAGKLPPAHIHARAKRYAVKLFLSHLHHVMFEVAYGIAPPKPYILEQGGHAHFLAPPNWP